MARKALTVPLEYVVGRGLEADEVCLAPCMRSMGITSMRVTTSDTYTQARAVGRAGTLGEQLDTVLSSLTLYWHEQGDGLRVRELLHTMYLVWSRSKRLQLPA